MEDGLSMLLLGNLAASISLSTMRAFRGTRRFRHRPAFMARVIDVNLMGTYSACGLLSNQ